MGYIPPKSRYKCMRIFMRPRRMVKDENGIVAYIGGNEKTNCILKIGHSGQCKNIRGETTGPTLKTADELRLEKLEMQLKDLKKQIKN